MDKLEFIDITLPTDNDFRYQINYSNTYGIHFNLVLGYLIDPKHPRCYFCGRFVKIKWDRNLTGPCLNCDELIWGY